MSSFYLFKTKDGYKQPYKGFDINNPDTSKMEDVESVIFVKAATEFQLVTKFVAKKADAKPAAKRSKKAADEDADL